MAGNLRNTFSRGSVLPRGCLTPRARILIDLANGYSANGIGRASSGNDLKSSYVPRESEILNKNRQITGYNRGKNRDDTATTTDPAVQEMTPRQGVQNANNMDSVVNRKEYGQVHDKNDAVYLGQREVYDNRINSFDLKQDTWSGGDHDYSSTPWQTVIRDVQAGMMGDTRNLNGDYRGQGFSQFGSGSQIFGLSALHGTADSGTQYGGIRRPSDEDVIQNSTGWNFALDIAERESTGKMPLPTYLGYDVKDNIELIEFVSEEYKEQIDTAWEMVQGTAPTIVIEIAKKGARFLPPHLQIGALGLLALVDICLTLKDVYKKWDADVRAYEQEHKCSREIAEENVSPLKNILNAAMIFSAQKCVKAALSTAEIHADSKVAIIAAALSSIPEKELRQWGRTITEWNRENPAW